MDRPQLSAPGAGRRPVMAMAVVALSLLPVGLVSSPAAATEKPLFAAPASIKSDCSVDVTKEINQWIASVPNKSTLSFTPGGCYRIEKTVLVKNRYGLTLEGNGSTFRAFTDGTGFTTDPLNRNHFYLWGGSNLVVRNLKVQGVNRDHRYHPKYEGQRGFRIAGVQGALLENLSIFEVRGDFVEVDPDYDQTWQWSSDITVRNSTFKHSGRQGFTITGGRRIVFADNRISGAALSMFDLEPDAGTFQNEHGVPMFGGAADVRIVNNDVGPAGLLFFGNVVPFKNVVVKDVVISGNRLRGIPLSIETVGHRDHHYKRFTITNNTSDRMHDGPRGAIELVYVDGALVSGNRVPFYAASANTQVGVKMWGSSDVVVKDNKFNGAKVAVQVDKPRFGRPWTGTASGTRSVCGNLFGTTTTLRLDTSCS